MPFCTIVEFEWSELFDRERFASLSGGADDPSRDGRSPEGRLARIAGTDELGARVIEVWRSGEDASAFAAKSAPELAAGEWPAPSRVAAFEVTSYDVS